MTGIVFNSSLLLMSAKHIAAVGAGHIEIEQDDSGSRSRERIAVRILAGKDNPVHRRRSRT